MSEGVKKTRNVCVTSKRPWRVDAFDANTRPSNRYATRFSGRWCSNIGPFSVDGRTDLSMVVYNPATPANAEKKARSSRGVT
jgi:hypothetical protein